MADLKVIVFIINFSLLYTYLINGVQEVDKSTNPWLSDLNVFQKVADHFEAS